MARVKQGDVVKIHYTGKRSNGDVFTASAQGEPMQFTAGSGKVIPGIEEAVIGMEEGETKTAVLPPEKAYGNPRDELVVTVERSRLPDHVNPEPGQRLRFQKSSGEEIVAKVTHVSDLEMTVDANHPLAGEEVTFDIRLEQIV